jgi:hypothetical protein
MGQRWFLVMAVGIATFVSRHMQQKKREEKRIHS